MKLSNFKYTKTSGAGLGTIIHATVDCEITTGVLFWKKTEVTKVNICKEKYGTFLVFC